MRWVAAILLLVIVLAGAGYFLITARFLGREVLSGLPEPEAFEGPELAGGYLLIRVLRGTQSSIESPDGRRLVPLGGAGHPSVVRVGTGGGLIVGEVADLDGGRSGGFFLITIATGAVEQGLPEPLWRERVRALSGGEPPVLMDADSYSPPESAP